MKMTYQSIARTFRKSGARLRIGRWPALVFAGLCLFLGGLNPAPAIAQNGPLTISASDSGKFRSDRILVKPKAGADLSGLHAVLNVQVLKTFPEIGNLQILQLPATLTVTGAITSYQNSGLAEYAERDLIVHALATPNDFRYGDGSLWNLNNTGIYGGTPGADIHAAAGWDTQSTANNIIVAVIDTGIRLTHEDLAGNLWTNPGESGAGLLGIDKGTNGLDDDGDGYIDDVHGINAINGTGIPMDDYGHGSHVSGILGAVGNNTVGVVGVAWRVQIMPCKFLDSTGHGAVSDAIKCIDYARSKGAKIINASWGDYTTYNSTALRDAIASTRNAGMIFVAATGNDGTDNDANPLYPASYDLDNIVAVAATTRNDDKATWSNFGARTVDLGAPGQDVFSCWNASDTSYQYFSGTSMAAPHVSGACALVWAHYPNESYQQIINRVLVGTDPLPALAGRCVTGGRLNLQKALGAAAVGANFTANPSSGIAPLTVQFTDTSSGTVVTRQWNFGDGSQVSLAQNPSHTYTSAGSFTATLTVTGSGGTTSSRSQVITVIPNYSIQSTTFNWIDPSAMTALTLADDGVSAAQSLPFAFTFYGKSYSQIFVGANGLAGFSSGGLNSAANTDLPNAGLPNAALYPYWTDLNPSLGGSVRIGVTGSAPNRRAVISWVDVPFKGTLLSSTRYSFQMALLEGSNQILFQYLSIQPNRLIGERQSGTVGIENDTGTVAAKYMYNESPATLANNQALLFVPGGSASAMSVPAASPSSTSSSTAPLIAGVLFVSPDTGLGSHCITGGSASPASQTFTLTNSGNASLNWAAAKSQSWIALSATGGTLAAGATATVTVSLDSSVSQFPAGTYNGSVTFVNTSSGLGSTTRKVLLKSAWPARLVAGTNATLGGVSFRVIGSPLESYVVQATTNFSTWTSILTNRTSNEGWFEFTDPQAGTGPRRFYRAADQGLTASVQALSAFSSTRILVKPKAGVALATLAPLHVLNQAQVVKTFPAIGNLQVLQVPNTVNLAATLASYLLSGLVQYAEPDSIAQILAAPNDFRYTDGSLWHLNNLGQNGGRPDADIDAPEAWDIITSANNLLVAIVDTGVRYTHEDLAANIWSNPGETPGDGIDNDGDGIADDVHGINAITGSGDPMDDHGHGSHVAGIIGGVGNNSIGVVGVCWQAQIMACKFLDAEGNGTVSDAITCIDFARSKGVKVINASWGTTAFNSQALRDAIVSARDADIIFVAAAGNSAEDNSVDPIYPASFDVDNIISVAATTRTDDLASFSNYGATTVHLAAPGSPIFSTWGSADNAYQYLDGTSMAAATVSGACALVRAKFPNENYRQIINRVLSGVDKLPGLQGKCITGGRLNLFNALGATPPPPLPTVTVAATDATASESGDTGTFTITRAGDTTAPLSVNFTVGGTASNGSDYQQLASSVTIAAGSSSATITVTPIDDTLVEGDETVILTLAANATYNIGSPNSATITITDNDSTPPPLPTVTVVATDATASESGDTGTFAVSRNGDTSAALTVNYTLGGTASNGSDYQQLASSVTIAAGSSSANITITPIDDTLVEGDETVILTLAANATYNIGSPNSATITIADNDTAPPPAPVANFTANPSSGQAPLTVQFTDQSTGSISAWDWNFGDGSAHSSTQNPSHTYTNAGDFTAALTVTGPGGSSSKSMTIHVTSATPPPPPTITVAATDLTASESGDTGTFTITRTGDTSTSLTVSYSMGGTAINGTDYQRLPGSVTIPAGASSVNIILRPIDDHILELPEEAILTLSPGSAYNLGLLNFATITILDNEIISLSNP